ncbi:MAG TPA: BON domain-containing protein [Nitrospiraceae bacterium]|nr:BON domain-containing protein [Nitrospiraceae bacterium]
MPEIRLNPAADGPHERHKAHDCDDQRGEVIVNVRLSILSILLVLTLGPLLGFKGGPATLPDPDIEAAIKQRLAMDGRIDSRTVQVHVEDGTVTLGGTVDTLEEKFLADNLVVSTQGVKGLRNAILVKPTPTRDDVIERTVEETFKTVPVLKNKRLHVSVTQGVVTLKGSVEKPLHSVAAEKSAQTVPGVVDVVNLIKVVGTPRPDREIERDCGVLLAVVIPRQSR